MLKSRTRRVCSHRYSTTFVMEQYANLFWRRLLRRPRQQNHRKTKHVWLSGTSAWTVGNSSCKAIIWHWSSSMAWTSNLVNGHYFLSMNRRSISLPIAEIKAIVSEWTASILFSLEHRFSPSSQSEVILLFGVAKIRLPQPILDLARTWLPFPKWHATAMNLRHMWTSVNGSTIQARRYWQLVRIEASVSVSPFDLVSVLGVRDFPSMDDAETTSASRPVRPKTIRSKYWIDICSSGLGIAFSNSTIGWLASLISCS